MKIVIMLLFLASKTWNVEENISIDTMKCEECNYLELIYSEYSNNKSNYFANKYIPLLVEKSNIPSNADKGTLGYIYKEDSVFYSDIKLWKEYFKCENGNR